MKQTCSNLLLVFFTLFFWNTSFSQYSVSDGGTINTCSGTFTDAGGSGNYSDNETYLMTFCSGSTDEITFDFSGLPFGLQANNDVLTIWDGPGVGVSAPLWSSITENGIVNPGAITSSTGCLTFEFVSDGITNNVGWEAIISCPSCSDGILNGYETNIDCGGPTCSPCANCFDGIQNGDETGIDCGGSCGNLCHCTNGILDGDETAIDCGGSCDPCEDSCNITASYVSTPLTDGCCDYLLELNDTYGDGWTGGQLNVLVNGIPIGPFTLASGSTSSQTINLCSGDNIQFDYAVVGSYADEVFYNFSNPEGESIFLGFGTSVVSNAFNSTVVCSEPTELDCNGGSVTLTASGIGSSTIALSNDFDSQSMGEGWTTNVQADFNNPCDPSLDGGAYLWMGNSAEHPREIETIPLDVSCGGEICFLLDFASQGIASPCEGIDLGDEGVYLEYSIDGGNTWLTMEYYGPEGVGNYGGWGGTHPQMTSWTEYCLTIPDAAMTATTQFHWAQTGSSGLDNDHWGIDNVSIAAVANCDPYLYDWTQIPGNDNSSGQIENITSDTTFVVWYGNTTDGCSTEVVITIPASPEADAGLDQVFCPEDNSILIGGNPVSVDEGATYTWSTGETGVLVLTGASIVNGQISVSPLITTDYYLEVSLNGCTGYDTVSVEVDLPPTATFPDDIVAQCDVPLPDIEVVIDESDDFTLVPIVTHLDDVSDGLSCPETITRTYRVTDECGNFVDVVQIITIQDTIPPVMDSPPSDLSVQCIGNVPVMTDLTWTDNCDGTGLVSGEDVSDGLSCPETITRSWFYTDTCGNVSSIVSQLITVMDTEAPVMDAPSADLLIQCIGDVPVMTDLTWTDNCDGTGLVSGEDVSDGLSCPETITRSWFYTDTCGNVSNIVSQFITVMDTEAPVMDAPSADLIIQCIGDVPVMTDLTWTDNCDGTGLVSGEDVSDGLSCPETITRSWFYTDTCGNISTIVIQLITVMDTIAPTGSDLVDLFITGGMTLPAPDILEVLDAADNCTTNPIVEHVSDISDGGDCPQIITRTYSITDECGNETEIIQLISVSDSIIPTASDPMPISVQCVSNVPTPDSLVVIDETDNGATPIVTWEDDTSDGLICPQTITRRYRVTDDCDNFIFVIQLITVQDTILPEIDAPPSNFSVQCIGDIPIMTDLTWTDNCDGVGVVSGDDVSDGLSCPETITRSWFYTDTCGNVSNVISQLITVMDTIMPLFDTPPLNSNVQCAGDIPAMTDLTWTDNCDGTGVVSGNDVSDELYCPETITRTWTYTDICGNIGFISQLIIIEDTQPPVMNTPLANLSIQCIGDLPIMTDLSWTDNCDGTGIVTGQDLSDGLSCPETITRSWFYTDTCGNISNIASQLIIVNDTIAPTGSDLITISIAGGTVLPLPEILDVFDEADNCTENPIVIHLSDISDGGDCPEIITRTYSIKDDCGNETKVIQLISIGDAFVPTASNPLPITVQCSSDVPLPDSLVVTDEADNGAIPIVSWEDDNSDGFTCPETIVRRYRVADDCGNVIFVSQIITIHDTIAPVLSAAPADIGVQCSGDVPAMISLQFTDNCNGNGNVLGSDSPLTNECGGVIVRTWTYVDSCGNSAIEIQNISVNDTIPPTANSPASVNVECIDDVPNWDVLSVSAVFDNCSSNPFVVWENDMSDGQSCPETITRSYSITDDCGNQTMVSQTITVDDITLPTASNPETISVATFNDIPTPNGADVIDEADNCTVNPIVTWIEDVSNGNTCNLEEITRTYLVKDECDNEIIVTQLIIVLAVPAPIDAGLDQTICLGDYLTLSATNPLNANLTWSPILPSQPYSPTQTETYTVTADYFGCISTDEISIFIANPPNVNFVGDELSGCEPHEVNFSNLTDVTQSGASCEWVINGETLLGCDSISYLFNNSGTYDVSLTVTTIEGCSSAQIFTDYINVHALPIAQFSANTYSVSTFNNSIELTNNSLNADYYEWSFGDESSISNEENPTHTYDAIGNSIYTITLWAYESLFGCVDSTRLNLIGQEELIYYVPNTFTPDGDSYNQTFQPVFTEGFDPYDFHMLIFNRWGEIVFETFDAKYGWNGHYGDHKAQDGTYTWKIDFKESMSDKRHFEIGHVNILQ